MINESFIKVKSSWGHDILNLYLTQSQKSDSIVILFPGANYSCDRPLLHYARKATLLSGCDVLSLEYGYFKTNDFFKVEFLEQVIKESYEAVKIALSNSYKRVYFISKSLGTVVAGEISKLIGYDKINNLFLTPITHTIPHIVSSKCIVVVGTKDKSFSEENIETIRRYPSVDLRIINRASHSLEVDDNYIESLEVLKYVTTLCADFVFKDNFQIF